jgi:Notch-like protein
MSLQDPGKLICNCTANYGGSNCQILTNPCSLNPCTSGQGYCQTIVNNGSYSYICNCITGYTGQRCENLIDNCASNPCKNIATCINQVGVYQCSCLPNYYGINCENIYLCSQSPCFSTGTNNCVDSLNNFTCNCLAGYTGKLCDTLVNQCASVNEFCLNQ